jgi:hypothetical protein
MDKLRSVFTFYTKCFNNNETKDYYVNPANYGDDVAMWLAEEMEKNGATIKREKEFPGQEDFGWYFKFVFHGNS